MSGYKSRPTLPQLINQVRADLLSRMDQDDVLRRSDAEVFARTYAAAAHTLYGYIAYLEKNILPDLADEAWLQRHAAMKKCPRKLPTPSAGFVRWEGVPNGMRIEVGTIVQNQDNGLLQFEITAPAISSGGVLRAPLQCLSAGKETNIDDGRQLMLIIPVDGLSSSAVADSILGGSDIEDVDAWRSRVIDRWYYMPQGGADHDYVTWAEEVPGITKAWSYRNWMGAGTVGIACVDYGSDTVAPPPATLNVAKSHIEPKAPVAGTELYVFAPSIKYVAHRVRVTPDTPAVRAAVESELKAFYVREGYPQNTIEISRLREAISSANGEYKHELVSPVESFALKRAEIALPGQTSWT
ncbi:MAG: baseplate J/gp47 family protein [Plesiomonas sp.]